MEKLEWLKSLKVNDQVAIPTSYGWGNKRNSYMLKKVVKITSTGRINLENGYVIEPDTGKVRGNKEVSVKPVTKQVIKAMEHLQRVIMLEKHFDSIDLFKQEEEKVSKLAAFIKELQFTKTNQLIKLLKTKILGKDAQTECLFLHKE